MKHLSLLLYLCTYSWLQKKHINLTHLSLPRWDPAAKGKEAGNTFPFNPLLPGLFKTYRNYLGLREWEINLKDINGGWGDRKPLQKRRARTDFPRILPSHLIRGRSVQEEERINKPVVPFANTSLQNDGLSLV